MEKLPKSAKCAKKYFFAILSIVILLVLGILFSQIEFSKPYLKNIFIEYNPKWPISKKDYYDIIKAVRTETDDEIISLQYFSKIKVEIQTLEHYKNPLNAGGQEFILQKEENIWVITEINIWMS